MNPELKKLLERLNALQTEYKGKPMPQNVGDEFERLAGEAESLQKEADREAQIKKFERFASQVPDAVIPAAPGASEQKSERPRQTIAGYITPGALFASSEAFAAYKRAGMPMQAGSAPVEIEEFADTKSGERLIPLTVEQRKSIEAAIEQKAIPTLAAGVIDTQRVDATPVQAFAFRRLRDIVNVSRTTSNAVDFMYRSAHTNAATVVADTAVKPEGAWAYSKQQAIVKTIAEHIPVTEQMLEDAPQVINMINVDLMTDLEDALEGEMMYGIGTGEHFLGLAVDPSIVAARTPAGTPTLLDRVRAAATDVRRGRYQTTAILIDPLDAEAIETLKGTDGRYVYAVATEAGVQRLWGIPMIETPAVEEVGTGERNIIVGDFQRGATLWLRSDAAIAMGWVNDQFIRNMRTIRAEMRAAFAVRAGGAFRKIVTAAGS